MQLRKTDERLVLFKIKNNPNTIEYLKNLSVASGSYHVLPDKLVCFKTDDELRALEGLIINYGITLSKTDLDLIELIQLNDEDLFDFAAETST